MQKQRTLEKNSRLLEYSIINEKMGLGSQNTNWTMSQTTPDEVQRVQHTPLMDRPLK